MTKPLYTPESEADTKLDHLGYNASVHDLVVQAAHIELNRFLENEGEAVRMWGWDPNSLHAADRYRIAQLLRSFIYQEQCIVTALRGLDEEYRAYVDSSPQARANAEAFIASLNQAAARRAVDLMADRRPWDAGASWLTDDVRDRAAKDLVALWQGAAPVADAHASQTEQRAGDDGPSARAADRLVAGVFANGLKGTPGFSKVAKAVAEDARYLTSGSDVEPLPQFEPGTDDGPSIPVPRVEPVTDNRPSIPVPQFEPVTDDGPSIPVPPVEPVTDVAERVPDTVEGLLAGVYVAYPGNGPSAGEYLQPPFRRIHTMRSIVDFHAPEIARELGPRSGMFPFRRLDSEGNEVPEDTSFKGSGFDMVLWRLRDLGYPRERIPDGLLYDLVDTVLAVQAEYQLQCFFVDRELARIIDTRGKEEQWLYQKTAEWAAERARAEMEAKAKSSAFWGLVGDILGLVSAAAGVLALIPVLTPIMAPVAIVTAVASMGAHAAAASISGNWDAATIAGLGADALAAIPAVGAVAKGAKGAWAAARMNKVANVIFSESGRAFVGAIAGKGASNAARIFDHVGKKGAALVEGTVSQGQLAGKVLQGSVSLATQVPLVIELSSGSTVDQAAKNAATGTALTANFGQTVGEWDTVGTAVKKAGTISIERFSRFFSR
ncbi:hypothetical protein [Streptomyces sp. NPDC048637]|uniref:hypothetical protein n=1 Tax=Streptomyces sp. NPDC048637 TaxID=3155636 RepID=UPI00341BBE03